MPVVVMSLVPWWRRSSSAAQKFFVPADKLEYLLSLARDVAEGPDQVPAHIVARLKGPHHVFVGGGR